MLSHGQTVHFRPHSVIHHLKAMHHRIKMSYLEPILVHPVRRQNFAGKLHSTFHNIWDLVICNAEISNSNNDARWKSQWFFEDFYVYWMLQLSPFMSTIQKDLTLTWQSNLKWCYFLFKDKRREERGRFELMMKLEKYKEETRLKEERERGQGRRETGRKGGKMKWQLIEEISYNWWPFWLLGEGWLKT